MSVRVALSKERRACHDTEPKDMARAGDGSCAKSRLKRTSPEWACTSADPSMEAGGGERYRELLSPETLARLLDREDRLVAQIQASRDPVGETVGSPGWRSR